MAALSFAAATLLALACEPELGREQALEGKLCRAEKPRCLDGYECHTDTRPGSPLADDGVAGVCMRQVSGIGDLQGVSGSAGANGGSTNPSSSGAAGASSTTDVNAGAAGADGTSSTTGNSAGSAGAAASSSGTSPEPGAAGNGGMPPNTGNGQDPPTVDDTNPLPSADAGSPPAAEDPGSAPGSGSEDCSNPVQLYRDLDGDTYGSDAEGDQKFDCPQSGWATRGGDCLDEAPTPLLAASVHPGQTLFFETGYPDASKPGGISFDYDCKGDEVGDPTNYGGGTSAPECSSPPPCSEGSGFVGGDRSGIGINALCGSVKFIVCSSSCDVVSVTPPQFRCH